MKPKKIFQYTIVLSLFALEIFLIYYYSEVINQEFGETWKKIWKLSSLIVVLLIIPLIIISALAKSIFGYLIHIGMVFKPQISIRPFDTVLREPQFNSRAAANLLFHELSLFISTGTGRQRRKNISTEVRFSEIRTHTPTISFVGATLPVEWLGSKIRKFVGLDAIEIHGLIDDSTEKISIMAWTRNYYSDDVGFKGYWVYSNSSDTDTKGEAFKKGIQVLARDIARDLKPDTVANFYWSQFRYDEALDTLRNSMKKREYQTLENYVTLGWLYLESDNYNASIQEFEKARELLPNKLGRLFRLQTYEPSELSIAVATAYTCKGDYDRSIAILEDSLKILDQKKLTRGVRERKAQICSELANVYAYKEYKNNQYEQALQYYEKAEYDFLGNLHDIFSSVSNFSSIEEFKQRFFAQLENGDDDLFPEDLQFLTHHFLTIVDLFDDEELDNALRRLGELYRNRGRNHFIRKNFEAAKKDYQKEIIISEVRQYVVDVDVFLIPIYLSLGTRYENIAFYYEDIDNYDMAMANYEDCIQSCQETLKTEENDIATLTDLSWAYCGKYSCLFNQIQRIKIMLDENYRTFLFSMDTDIEEEVLSRSIPQALRKELENHEIFLSDTANILPDEEMHDTWHLRDEIHQFTVQKNEDRFDISYYRIDSYSIIQNLSKLLMLLPEKEQKEWVEEIEKISDSHFETENYYLQALSETSLFYVNTVLEEGNEEHINFLLQISEAEINLDMEEQNESTNGIINILNKTVSAGLDEEKIQFLLESEAIFERIHKQEFQKQCETIYRFILQVIYNITQLDVSNDVSLLLLAATKNIEKNQMRTLTIETFNELSHSGELHHQAEALFGNACLYAIESNKSNIYDALDYLEEAIQITTPEGGNSSEYRNRAKLDSDFDKIRFEEEFHHLVW